MKITEKTFISVDIETTGLGKNAKIIEIGAVKFNPFGITLEFFDELIHPGIEIPEEVISIHGITDEMVENKPEINEIMPAFIEFVELFPIIAHNSRFDFSFLSKMALFSGVEFKENHVFDTLTLSRKAFPGIKHNLTYLSKYLGLIPDGSRHRGLSDAKLASGLFELCLDKLNINSYEELIERFKPKAPMDFLR